MSRKYVIECEVEMPEETDHFSASTWLASVLEMYFQKKNPDRSPNAPLMVSTLQEHPYRPRVIGAREVAQPLPRQPAKGG